MAEQGLQDPTTFSQPDASSVKPDTQNVSQQHEMQAPAGPLLPSIQHTSTGLDQNGQGSMQASSPQQQQKQQPPPPTTTTTTPTYGAQHQQQQQQQQQHNQQHLPQQQAPPPQQQQPLPPPPHQHHHQHQQQHHQQQSVHSQSPLNTPQSHYEQSPQQSHYAQQPQQPQQQQQLPQYDLPPPPQSNGAPPGYAPAQQVPPPHHNPYQYQQPQYQQPPPPQVNGDANGFPPQMRYSMPLPPNQMDPQQQQHHPQQQQQQQQLSGTRHKKEIKRRTKTGCLTCRKRRIKCDEGHPSCRNCQKSKRECLGYDPIFKAQTGQPANIQPQPGSIPPPSGSHSPNAPPPLAHPQYSNVPQGYAPASSAGYAPAMAMQSQLDPSFDYGNAIDPALAAAHPAAPHPPPAMPPPQEEYTTVLLPERKVRLIKMDDVFSLDAVQPSFPPPRDPNAPPLPQQEIDAIRDLYYDYASGLDRFFETDWYSAAGLPILLSDPDLLHYFSHCLSRFHSPPSDQNNPKGLPSIEARLIWLLASLAFSPTQNSSPPLPFLPRIEAVSHLILGTFMAPDHVPPAPTMIPDPKTQPDAYAFYLQDLFWHHLSTFTTIHDDLAQNTSSGTEIANQLTGMRNILSMLENRDVLYSMAIARHFGGRMEKYDPDKLLVGRGGEAEDPIDKLVVAMGFLGNEECQGTTQVVQRLCGMSRRGFLLQRPEQAPGALKPDSGSIAKNESAVFGQDKNNNEGASANVAVEQEHQQEQQYQDDQQDVRHEPDHAPANTDAPAPTST